MEAQTGPIDRAKELLGCILSDADGLQLSERQVTALNRLYWLVHNGSSPQQIVSEAASLLSPEQFRSAVGRYTEANTPASSSVSTDTIGLESTIAAAVAAKVKDKAVVEIELATAVAERLIGWSKVFGIFVAVPIAILLVIFSLFGFAKFEDVRNAANRADELLKEAQTKFTASSSQLAATQKKVDGLIDIANQRAAEVAEQLKRQQESAAENSQQIKSALNATQRIESQLGGVSAEFETRNKPAGAVMVSGTGKLYGPWALTQRTAADFVKQPDFPWRSRFEGLTAGTPEFDAAWREIGESDAERFKGVQHDYVQKRFFEPAAGKLKESCGLDVTKRSRALQEMVWAFAVRTGPAVPPIVEACRSLHDSGHWDLADSGLDEALIRQSYQNLLARHLASPAEMAAVLRQLAEEKQQQGR